MKILFWNLANNDIGNYIEDRLSESETDIGLGLDRHQILVSAFQL